MSTDKQPVERRFAAPGARKLLLLSAAAGLVLGGSLGYSHFLSESRDWGKTWDNYNDFVANEIGISIGIVVVMTVLCWVIAVISVRLQKKTTNRKVSH